MPASLSIAAIRKTVVVLPFVPVMPTIGALAIRQAISISASTGCPRRAPPKLIMTPNLPMITKEKMTIEGVETVTPDEWPYAYGPEVAG